MQKFRLLLFKLLLLGLCAGIFAGCSAESKKARFLKRAESYFVSGDYDKAGIEYMSLLRVDPLNKKAIERLGVIWHEAGAPLRAFPFLFKTKELDPTNIANRSKLAAALMAVGHVEDAKKEAVSILSEAPDNEEALLLLSNSAKSEADFEAVRTFQSKASKREGVTFHLVAATQFLRKGDAEAAGREVQNALVADPKSAAAHSAMASLYIFRKSPSQAVEELRIASDLAPARSPAKLQYAKYKVENGAPEEGKKLLQAITRQTPDYLPAWAALAQISFGEKQYDEGLALLENITGRDPDNFEARLLRCQVFLAKGENKKGVEGLEQLNRTYPNVPLIKYQLARAYLQNSNAVQAPAMLTQAIAINPNYLDAILLLGELNLRAGSAAPVIASMQEVLKKSPNLKPAQLLLSEAYRLIGRFEDAVAIIKEQIKVSPELAQPHLLLGLLLRQQNKIQEARASFEKALQLEPENVLVFSQIIDLDVGEKKFDAALEKVHAQMLRTPKDAGAQFLEAKIYSAQNQWDKAEAALLKTLDLDPGFSKAYDLLIATYISADKLAPALGQLEGLLAKNPENARALTMTALILDKKGDYEKSRDAYNKVLAVTPDFIPALNNMSYLYSERFGQLDKAYEFARRARTVQPDEPFVADTLGWVLYKKGDFKQALSLIQESASKLPGHSEIQFHLGMASYMMGDINAAKTSLQTASDAPEEFPGKETIAPRLALLKEGAGGELSAAQLELLLKEHPGDLILLMRLADAYDKQGLFEKAASICDQVLKLNPTLLAPTLQLAQLNAGPLKNNEKALELAKRAKELAPSDPKAAAVLGNLVYRSGNYSWAYSLLQESARKLANNSGVLYDSAWASYSLGKVAEARAAMERALTAEPNFPKAADAKLFLAMTLPDQDAKMLAALQAAVEKTLKSDPKYVPALMIRAAAEIQAGDIKSAGATYLEVLRLFPDFTPGQRQLALLYAQQPENRAKAYELGAKARKILVDDAELAQALAELNFHRKEFAYAIQLFQETAPKKPLDAKMFYYLGMSYLQNKQKPLAKESLEKALAAGLKEPLAADAQHVIAELEKK